ncbi:MAG: DASS family sodium-coupled anion symporter [Vicinamibacterales bacterium]
MPPEPAVVAANRPPRDGPDTRVRLAWPFLALIGIYILIGHLVAPPDGVSPAQWRTTAVFFATIAGLMLQPLPGAALVLVGLTLMVVVGGVPMPRALSGFSAPSVWLVLVAIMMSRALRETGVARRIALAFVRAFGGSSLGVSYALVMSDVTLAAGIPSITARSGSIILPITRSIAELYDSKPGPSAPVLGTFLMSSLYQSSVIACAMFLTGQASNLLAAGLAAKLANVTITWSSWLVAGIVPGLVSCLVIPYLTYRMLPPRVKRTPAASDYARRELDRMGPSRGAESVTLAVFVGVVLMWVTSKWHGIDVTLVAFVGITVLILSRVLTWEGVLAERSAWDVFVWYGGLLTMGEILNETGSTTAFAAWVSAGLTGTPWLVALVVTLIVYFYVHYALASITTHILAMFPPFVLMLVGLGAPPSLVVYSLACLANLTAGLTHYGTTTAPIVYAEGYVSVRQWWRVGFVASVANLTIWLTIGFAWWKVLGFW